MSKIPNQTMVILTALLATVLCSINCRVAVAQTDATRDDEAVVPAENMPLEPVEVSEEPVPDAGPVPGESWVETPMGSGGSLTAWDYYAGSVYANTSPVWVDAEYLLWWVTGNSLPPLVTTSPNGTPVAEAGVLGAAGTTTLFGGDRVDRDARSGFRTSLGVRLGHLSDALMDAEVEASFFWLGDGQSSGNYYAASDGDPILARPFHNAQTDADDSQLIAYPGITIGDMLVQTDSDLISAGVRFRRGWREGTRGRVDWLLGYRYLRYQEDLTFSEILVSTDPGGTVDIGTEFDVYDEFATWNEFHGIDMGLQWWFNHGNWSAELLTKMAVGSVFNTVEVFGETLVTPPADTAYLTEGGLLAQPTNMGRYHANEFAVLPEVGIKLRRRLTHSFVLMLGYNVMFVNHVMRTGDQIDTAINISQTGGNPLIGPARPTIPLIDSNLWVHGFSIGLEW
jgi:hypothetical protein